MRKFRALKSARRRFSESGGFYGGNMVVVLGVEASRVCGSMLCRSTRPVVDEKAAKRKIEKDKAEKERRLVLTFFDAFCRVSVSHRPISEMPTGLSTR